MTEAGLVPFTSWEDPIIGLEIKPFNWRLRKAREARGWSRAALARAAGIQATTVGDAEKLRHISANVREKIALALLIPEDELFPGAIDALPPLDKDVIEVPFTEAQVTRWQSRTETEEIDAGVIQESLSGAVDEVLKTLTPREQRIVSMKYGIGYSAPRTYEDVAVQFGVSRERVRQIESEALRKLRHPIRSKQLRGFHHEDIRPATTETVSSLRPFCERVLHAHRGDVAALARVILEQRCCCSLPDVSGLRVHIIEEHGVKITGPWTVFEKFSELWKADQARQHRAAS